jgi:type VI secretion system protein ImpA
LVIQGSAVGLDFLLEPISEDAPCGADLEYDDEFRQLEEVARGKPGSVVDPDKPGASIAAVQPDWFETKSLALSILSKSKDLRAITYLVKAEIATGELAQVAPVLRATTEMVERYWSGLYPLLDADDDNDPTMRVNSLACLSDPEDVLRLLRETVLFKHGAYGTIKFRSLETGLGLLAESANPSDVSLSNSEAQLALMNGLESDPQNILALKECLDAARDLQTKVDELAGSRSMLDLKPLFQRLKPVVDFIEGLRAQAAESDANGDTPVSGEGGSGTTKSGQLNRDEAKRLIAKVCEFLEKTEPSSPAPLFLRRALALMDMSFLDIVRDLAPEAAGTFEHYGGARPSE